MYALMHYIIYTWIQPGEAADMNDYEEIQCTYLCCFYLVLFIYVMLLKITSNKHFKNGVPFAIMATIELINHSCRPTMNRSCAC